MKKLLIAILFLLPIMAMAQIDTKPTDAGFYQLQTPSNVTFWYNPIDSSYWGIHTKDGVKKWQRIASYNKTEYKINGKVSNAAYSGSWDGVTGIAPSKNAIYDKLSSMEPVSYCAATMTVNYGTLTQGTVANLCAVGGTDVIITELSGSNPLSVTFAFTGVTRLTGISFFSRYEGGSAHIQNVEIYNYTTSAWDYLGSFVNETVKTWHSYTLSQAANYIGSGSVTYRIVHQGNGIPGHTYNIDYIEVNYGGGSGGGGSSGATNLSYSASATDGTVNSDTGNDATIPAGSTTNASLMLPGDKAKLNGIAAGAEVNVNADWSAGSGDAMILNKPILFSGVYSDLTSKPTLFSGSYTDLTNKPTIPTNTNQLTNGSNFIADAPSDGTYYARRNATWVTSPSGADGNNYPSSLGFSNGTLTLGRTGLTDLTVPLDGRYKLIGWFPTWTDVTSKPTFATVATTGAYSDLTGKPTLFSGSYTDLTNKPTIPTYSVFNTISNGLVPMSGANTAKYLRGDGVWETPPSGSGMTYPAADGIVTKSGAVWGTSIADNSANWNKYNQWSGESTGLNAATGRTSLGLGTASQSSSNDFVAIGDKGKVQFYQGSLGYLKQADFVLNGSEYEIANKGKVPIEGDYKKLSIGDFESSGQGLYWVLTKSLSPTINNQSPITSDAVYNALLSKQTALSGTGFLKFTGTTPAYIGFGTTTGTILEGSHYGSTGAAHGAATIITSGFMTATDKTKLDGLSTYTLPVAGASLGGIKIGTSGVPASGIIDVQLNNQIAYVALNASAINGVLTDQNLTAHKHNTTHAAIAGNSSQAFSASTSTATEFVFGATGLSITTSAGKFVFMVNGTAVMSLDQSGNLKAAGEIYRGGL